MPTNLPAFLVTTLLLAMLPGAGQAFLTRQTLRGGRRLAWISTAGNSTGLVLWSAAAAAGLSAVLLANPTAYAMVRTGGGAVLIVLGVTTLYSARTRPIASPAAAAGPATAGGWAGYRTGLITSLGNPKAGVFAVSFLPQFVTAHGPILVSTITMGVLWSTVTGSWYLVFIWAVDRGRALLSGDRVRRRLEVATGCVLVLLGSVVAAGL